ncbi:O-succinylhomoserine sulfhydrylase [Aquaspirillum serpens]|uniref:O-succinylhomoserine sulfhydrylase n=1 Tax=Aquaspirillum serpens TaxID=190 RepID=UPI0003B611AE|nr:O-succinylhomoserine sulfhydrylase [Aquaspirillum serpens]
MSTLHPHTLAIRAGRQISEFNEHSPALYLTSSFLTESADEAMRLFSGELSGNTYSRFTNPTVSMFQDRLAALEGGERAIATASGMAAIHALIFSLLKAGDHIVASQSLFGATLQMFSNLLPKFGIEVSFVPLTDLSAWQAAVKDNTKLFFVETPSNPLTDIADLAGLAAIAHQHGAWLAVDNCFCSPALQRPIEHGADFVVHSATKFLDGHGRVLGGAVVGPDALIEQIYLYVRTAGPTLSAFNAWVLLSGLETLFVRVEKQAANALALAQWLETHPMISRVYYPGLASHPQHELAMRQQSAGGAIVSFEVKGGRDAAWRVVDNVSLISRTGNLGDVKSTITHPATTTHGRLTPEARAKAGIGEGLLRISVGLEHVNDLIQDLTHSLAVEA